MIYLNLKKYLNKLDEFINRNMYIFLIQLLNQIKILQAYLIM
jgi:hypothetical protein